MKSLIVYASKYGTTKKCAESIANQLENSTVINCKDSKNIKLEDYHQIIIGTSVYYDNSRKDIKKFIKNNDSTISQKKIALFICSAKTDDYSKLFSPEIADKAYLKAHLGHEMLISKMSKFDGFITKKVGGGTMDTSDLKTDSLLNFVKSLSK